MSQNAILATSPVARYVAGSRAPATVRAYQADLRDFSEWCAHHSAKFPISAANAASYLASLADIGAKPSTIQRRAVAIAAAHRAAGAANPISDELVRKTLAGIRRARGSRPAKKRALSVHELREMCQALPDTFGAIRDRAILTIAFAGALRRSEVVALDRADVRLSADEMVIVLRRSKTDQSGAGLEKHIPLASDASVCAVRAMRAWLAAARITSGPVFRAIDQHNNVRRHALTGQSVALIFKAAATAAGIDAAEIAGHSARSGFITAAYDAGQTEADIMEHSGHKSLVIMRGYRQDSGAAQRRVVRAVMDKTR